MGSSQFRFSTLQRAWSAALVLCIYAPAVTASPSSPISDCRRIISTASEVCLTDSLTDGQRHFKLFRNFAFGVTEGEGSGFVQYKSRTFRIESIHFAGPSGKPIPLGPRALAIDLSDLYVHDERRGRVLYCLLSPLSDLGQSGRFQQYAALIALRVNGATTMIPVGAIVRRP